MGAQHGHEQGKQVGFFCHMNPAPRRLKLPMTRLCCRSQVEGEAQGEDDDIASFLGDIDNGPKHAHVVRLDQEDREVVDGESGFEIRR
jgi:hypothetical protein